MMALLIFLILGLILLRAAYLFVVVVLLPTRHPLRLRVVNAHRERVYRRTIRKQRKAEAVRNPFAQSR